MSDTEYVKWIRKQTGYGGSIWIKRQAQHYLSGCVTETVWISGTDFAVTGPDMQQAVEAAVRELKSPAKLRSDYLRECKFAAVNSVILACMAATPKDHPDYEQIQDALAAKVNL